MPSDETTEILQRLTRLETKLDIMGTAKDTANEALLGSKSAHHRIDDLADKRIAVIEDNQRWLWRTSVGALIVGAIGLLWKGIGA